MQPTRETLRKSSNILRCIIPGCEESEAHRVSQVYRLCTQHHRLFMDLQYAINLVPIESKNDLLVEIMCLYDMTFRE